MFAHQLGNTNFFKLMVFLDSEKINPMREGGLESASSQPLNLTRSIQSLKPRIERLGIDVADFQEQCGGSVREIHKAWVHFITSQAKIVLTNDVKKLIQIAEMSFKNQSIKSSEVNSIINFILSYHEVIHHRGISKKDVIEGILMSGITKKSSFYQKISNAERENDGTLTWKTSDSHKDEIWRHFILQTCRFLKQTIHNLEYILMDNGELREKLQQMVDKAEFEQFNHQPGVRKGDLVGLSVLFVIGLFALLGMPMMDNASNGQNVAHHDKMIPPSEINQHSYMVLSANTMMNKKNNNFPAKDSDLYRWTSYGPNEQKIMKVSP